MDQLVQFSPTTIIFQFTPGSQTTTYLSLRNVSPHHVTYKMKTTHPKRYCVRPNAAIIDPGAQINVELTQQALRAAPDDLNNCRDRFLLQVANINLVPKGSAGGDVHGYQSVMDLWGSVPEQVTYKVKFGVILEIADVNEEEDQEQQTRNRQDNITTHSPSVAVHQRNPDSASISPSSVSCREPTAADLSPQSDSESRSPLETLPALLEEAREIHVPSSEPSSAVPNQSSLPLTGPSKFAKTSNTSDSKGTKELSAESKREVDYRSVEYARERALGIRIGQKIPLQNQDEPTRQRVAVERAGELVRTINAKQKDIDIVNRELSEARHRLSDARMATRPAYDVKYEVSDNSRVPYAQIAIMAIISGALLQLLV